MNQPVKSKGIHFVLPLVLFVFLSVELVICLVFMSSAKKRFLYEMNYELMPLEMKSITVTNREDLKEAYDCYGADRVYEVKVVWENIGPYYGDYNNGVEFEAKEDDGYIFVARPLDIYELGRRESQSQTVPAQKSGSFVWYVCANEYVNSIRIKERREKLEGECRSVEVPLPAEPGAAATVEIAD